MSVGAICRRNVITARATDDLISAARVMRERHIGFLIVVEPDLRDSTVRPIGVLTDRDIVTEVIAAGVDPKSLTVGDVMTDQPVAVAETSPRSAALAEMRRVGVRRLPVVGHRGQLVGIVSLDDVIATLARELQDVSGSIVNEQRIEGALRA